MKEYGIKVYEIEGGAGTEVDIGALPYEYVCGLIKMLEGELAGRKRLDGVYRKLADNINRER